LKSQIESARTNLNDFKLTLEASVETEDTVWARCRATGIDPRSGKPVTIDVLDICRFRNGKLVEHWGVPDRFVLLHQIGALPPRPTYTLRLVKGEELRLSKSGPLCRDERTSLTPAQLRRWARNLSAYDSLWPIAAAANGRRYVIIRGGSDLT
jgi:hypothetical protein